MSKIDKAVPGQGERALHDDELDAVSGGVADSEAVAISDSENPGAIKGLTHSQIRPACAACSDADPTRARA